MPSQGISRGVHAALGFLAIILAILSPHVVTAAESVPLAARQAIARDLVQEALQREIYGSHQERLVLLHEAQSQDATSLSAKWHQGLVQTLDGGWVRPEEFDLDPSSKGLLKQYREIRQSAADTVLAQFALANWCAERKLPHQERAHLWRVLTLDPEHTQARRRLGFVQIGKDWFAAEDAANHQAAQAARAEALAEYRDSLEEILRDLQHRSLARQAAGRKALAEIADPRALPAIEEVLGPGGGNIAALTIEKISQFDDLAATLALCRFAVLSAEGSNRKLAAEKLKQRNTVDYVPVLLDLLVLPLQTQYIAVAAPNGVTSYQHVVVREDRNRRDIAVFNRRHFSEVNAIRSNTSDPLAPGPIFGTAQAQTNARRQQAIQQIGTLNRAALIATMRERSVQQANSLIAQSNARVMAVLKATTGQQYMAPDAWWGWWLEEIDRQPQGKYTTFSKQYSSQHTKTSFKYAINPNNPSCFSAGTQVWSVDGRIAIEELQVGDLVLSKDIYSGELCYKPVLATTIRPPSPIVTFKAGNDHFRTSRGHLFWQSGAGWTQARRLQPGTILHAAADPVRVSSIAEAAPEPTYNLVVADFHTYFVGHEKVFTHDVTEEEPVDVLVPGLANR